VEAGNAGHQQQQEPNPIAQPEQQNGESRSNSISEEPARGGLVADNDVGENLSREQDESSYAHHIEEKETEEDQAAKLERKRLLAQLPKKPRALTAEEKDQEIRAALGYDTQNVFTDAERDEAGMRRELELKDGLAIMAVLEKRKLECHEKLRMIEYRYKEELASYEKAWKEYPGYAKLLKEEGQADGKKKRAAGAAVAKGRAGGSAAHGAGPTKRQRQVSDDEEEGELHLRRHPDGVDSNRYGDDEDGKDNRNDMSQSDDDGSEFNDHDDRRGSADRKKTKSNKRLNKIDEKQAERDGLHDQHHDHRDEHQGAGKTPLAEDDDQESDIEHGKDLPEFQISEDMGKEQKEALHESLKAYDKKMKGLAKQQASFEDIRSITIRRAKIEQWVDEPFFGHTIKDLFVKVGTGKKFLLAQVKEVKMDEDNQYAMTNGKKTGWMFKLMLTEDKADKLKLHKINQISNQEATQEDFGKLKTFRNYYKVPPVMKDWVYRKQQDLKHARNYIYKDGEIEAIAKTKFERALKAGNLSDFPNVTFFYKKYIMDRDQALGEKEELEHELKQPPKRSKEEPMDGSEPEWVKQRKAKLRKLDLLDPQIEKLNRDIEIMAKHLKEDLRMSHYEVGEGAKPVSIENIESQEQKKKYHEWLETQPDGKNLSEKALKQQLLQKHKLLRQAEEKNGAINSKLAEDRVEAPFIDEKEKLYLEI